MVFERSEVRFLCNCRSEYSIKGFSLLELTDETSMLSHFKKEGQKTDKKETGTTSSERERETYSSGGESYTPTYTESNGSRYSSQAPASEQPSSDSAGSNGNDVASTQNQAANTSEVQAETNTNSNNAGVPTTNSDDLASLGGGVTSFGQQ